MSSTVQDALAKWKSDFTLSVERRGLILHVSIAKPKGGQSERWLNLAGIKRLEPEFPHITKTPIAPFKDGNFETIAHDKLTLVYLDGSKEAFDAPEGDGQRLLDAIIDAINAAGPLVQSAAWNIRAERA